MAVVLAGMLAAMVGAAGEVQIGSKTETYAGLLSNSQDLRQVRGANYLPSNAAQPLAMWLNYSSATVERELAYAKQLRLNTVRVELQFFAWYADPSGFMANYEHFLGACERNGLQALFIVFDADFVEPPVATLEDIRPWLATGAWQEVSPHPTACAAIS